MANPRWLASDGACSPSGLWLELGIGTGMLLPSCLLSFAAFFPRVTPLTRLGASEAGADAVKTTVLNELVNTNDN